MNVAEITKRIQKQFGDESGAEITPEDILSYINDGQVDIARHTGCLQDAVETDAIAGQRAYALPPNFLGIRRLTYNGKKVSQIALEDLDEIASNRDVNNPTGEPSHFYIWANEINFYPIPDVSAVGNIDIFYTKLPEPLLGDLDVPEIPVSFHEDLVRYGLSRAKELDEETQDSQLIWGEYKDRVNFSKSEHEVPDNSSYPSVRLVAGDD